MGGAASGIRRIRHVSLRYSNSLPPMTSRPSRPSPIHSPPRYYLAFFIIFISTAVGGKQSSTNLYAFGHNGGHGAAGFIGNTHVQDGTRSNVRRHALRRFFLQNGLFLYCWHVVGGR